MKLLSVAHQHSTLIISVRGDTKGVVGHSFNFMNINLQYKKPAILLEMEKAVLVLLQDVETTSDLDVDCNDLLKELMA